MAIFNRKDKDKEEPAEGGEQEEPADDGITEIEGFEDPFEEEWDDATMNESLKEWERMLADSDTEMINQLNPSTPPPSSAPETDLGLTDPNLGSMGQ